MHNYRGPFRIQRFIPGAGEKQFSSQEFNFDDDIHTIQPRLPAEYDAYSRQFWWIFAAVTFIVFFLVLLFVLTIQLVSKAVSRHNQNKHLQANMENYFSTRNSKTDLVRSLSATFPAKDDNCVEYLQFCRCHGQRISV